MALIFHCYTLLALYIWFTLSLRRCCGLTRSISSCVRFENNPEQRSRSKPTFWFYDFIIKMQKKSHMHSLFVIRYVSYNNNNNNKWNILYKHNEQQIKLPSLSLGPSPKYLLLLCAGGDEIVLPPISWSLLMFLLLFIINHDLVLAAITVDDADVAPSSQQTNRNIELHVIIARAKWKFLKFDIFATKRKRLKKKLQLN